MLRFHTPVVTYPKRQENVMDSRCRNLCHFGKSRQSYYYGDDAYDDAWSDSKPSSAHGVWWCYSAFCQLWRSSYRYRKSGRTGDVEYGGCDGYSLFPVSSAPMSCCLAHSAGDDAAHAAGKGRDRMDYDAVPRG